MYCEGKAPEFKLLLLLYSRLCVFWLSTVKKRTSNEAGNVARAVIAANVSGSVVSIVENNILVTVI